jgi:integrase/recombinase XerD
MSPKGMRVPKGLGQKKQAKILTDAQIDRVVREVGQTRYPARDTVVVLLSIRAGLRAKEIALATWDMVMDAEGKVGDVLELHDKVSKGGKRGNGGRSIPLHRDLRKALITLAEEKQPDRSARIIAGERDGTVEPDSIQIFFGRLYGRLGLKGASSHSGRRTFVTGLAKKIVAAGGSLRDVQQLAGHASLSTTQRYIEGNSDAKRRAIDSL